MVKPINLDVVVGKAVKALEVVSKKAKKTGKAKAKLDKIFNTSMKSAKLALKRAKTGTAGGVGIAVASADVALKGLKILKAKGYDTEKIFQLETQLSEALNKIDERQADVHKKFKKQFTAVMDQQGPIAKDLKTFIAKLEKTKPSKATGKGNSAKVGK